MLAFEHGAAFDLEVLSRSGAAFPILVAGATREGTFTFRINPGATGLITTNIFRIPDVPVFLSVYTETASIWQGDQFVAVYLRSNSTRLLRLCSGYIETTAGIGWPNTQTIQSMPGRGSFYQVASANPAAGAELTMTVPDNELWIVKGLTVTLVTDSNTATRLVHFVFELHGGPGTFDIAAPATQLLSLTRTYTLLPVGAGPTTVSGDDILVPIPNEIIMTDNDILSTTTDNIQAGDDFGVARVAIEKFVLSVTD